MRQILSYTEVSVLSDNKNKPDETDESYDRFWKIAIFGKLSDSYSTYYSPNEHTVVDEIIVLFKGRVIFKQYVPKKQKWFGINFYKLRDANGYIYNTRVYSGKDRKCALGTMTATHANVTGLIARIKNVEHKLYTVTRNRGRTIVVMEPSGEKHLVI